MNVEYITCRIDRLRMFILSDYPKYYRKNKEVKLSMISDFVGENHIQKMYDYMEENWR